MSALLRRLLIASLAGLGTVPAPVDPIADSIDRALAERKAARPARKAADLRGRGERA